MALWIPRTRGRDTQARPGMEKQGATVQQGLCPLEHLAFRERTAEVTV